MLCYYVECHYDECSILFTIMLDVVMLNVIMIGVVAPTEGGLLGGLGCAFTKHLKNKFF